MSTESGNTSDSKWRDTSTWRGGSLREPLVMHLAAQQRSKTDHRKPVDIAWVAEAIIRIVEAEESGGAT